MNSVSDLLNNRMSLRKYADRPIKDEDLNLILEGALRAPTAGNMMMYSILVVKDEEKKKKLSQTCDNQPFIAKAPVILIFLADMQRLYDYFKYSNVEEFCEESSLKYETPDMSRLFLGASDAFIASQNAVIAAESMGIGSCYIGDIVENYEIHKEMFNLPKWVFPVSMICLGYYPEDAKRVITPRFDRKFVVYDEEYKSLSNYDFQEMFKEREKKVSPNNIYGANNFGQLLYARKFGSNCMSEMERSLKVMLKQWNEKM